MIGEKEGAVKREWEMKLGSLICSLRVLSMWLLVGDLDMFGICRVDYLRLAGWQKALT